jgi:hypothetical protein
MCQGAFPDRGISRQGHFRKLTGPIGVIVIVIRGRFRSERFSVFMMGLTG